MSTKRDIFWQHLYFLNCESHETVSFIRNMTRRGYENRNVSKIETDISFFDPSVSFMKRFSLFKKNPFHQMWETERFLIVIIHIFHFEHLGNSSIIGHKGKTNLSERSKSCSHDGYESQFAPKSFVFLRYVVHSTTFTWKGNYAKVVLRIQTKLWYFHRFIHPLYLLVSKVFHHVSGFAS